MDWSLGCLLADSNLEKLAYWAVGTVSLDLSRTPWGIPFFTQSRWAQTWGSDLAKAPLNPISSESVVAAVVFPVPRIVDSSY
ncbi:hypothetical protein PCASD_08012 [Puccinia coronata f. sp. avenae]|uniref:Uncharacterized protein n=1 Tax=Puccinia coronata f. sp. avenae TaxID=200324 RepID=A0A2N5UP79_9BASI|nr:hypothetical protein PCASD_08012 [Puccinia coronata f. sp. avenae]